MQKLFAFFYSKCFKTKNLLVSKNGLENWNVRWKLVRHVCLTYVVRRLTCVAKCIVASFISVYRGEFKCNFDFISQKAKRACLLSHDLLGLFLIVVVVFGIKKRVIVFRVNSDVRPHFTMLSYFGFRNNYVTATHIQNSINVQRTKKNRSNFARLS